MISFNSIDIAVITLFFITVLIIGFISGRKAKTSAESYLLNERKVGLFLFVLTNVSTWYGGILGVGEFSYKYGLLSWFTQGFPYYIFAFLFALFFAKKIRQASLFTIPDKIIAVYGEKAGLMAAIVVFVLVSPAPYLLMAANLFSLIFKIGIIPGLIFSLVLSSLYLIKGGYKADLYTDAFQFFVMFAGFIIIVLTAFLNFGGSDYLISSLPKSHLTLTGNASPAFIIVWFLVALWTFADPGFHQRCYAAKNGNVAAKGIIISIFFWALFDFLTTVTGLYSRAVFPNLENQIMSFPMLAQKLLSPGLKGLFYAALFATILSTLNSFFFLSATTIGRDFIFRFYKMKDENQLKKFTVIGLLISGVMAGLLAYFIPSVIQIWYTIGSICIPAIILPIISAYNEKLKIGAKYILWEMTLAVSSSFLWFLFRKEFALWFFAELEPMLVGLSFSIAVHLFGMIKRGSFSSEQKVK